MDNIQHNINKAIELYQSGKIIDAINIYRVILKKAPQDGQTLFLLGTAYLESGRHEKSIDYFRRSLANYPTNISTLNNLAIALTKNKNYKEAIDFYHRAIALNPNIAQLHHNCGSCLLELKKYPEVITCCDRAISLKPDYAEAYNNRGIALVNLKRIDEAIQSYKNALSYNNDYPEAFNNLGMALADIKKFDEAISNYHKAISLNRNYAEAYFNLANSYASIQKLAESVDSYSQAIALKKDYVEAYVNRGNVFGNLRRINESLRDYTNAISINPNYSEAYVNRGNYLADLNMLVEAIKDYKKALKLKPDCEFLPGKIIHASMNACFWNEFEVNTQNLQDSVDRNQKIIDPFSMLGLSDCNSTQKLVAEIYTSAYFPSHANEIIFPRIAQCKKIKVGYFSADFHDHATMHLIAEMLEKHDKNNYEIYAFSFGPETHDAWRMRAKNAVDYFIPCYDKADASIAEISRDKGIDIAVDLKGFTKESRQGIFTYRAAPIQVNFLGFPGTMGADYIDYIIADHILIPEENRSYYSEKIAYMPHCYQPNCRIRKISDINIKRQEIGLPDNAFIFCSFNSNWKILPQVFSSWIHILNCVPDSVLWLMVSNETAKNNLISEAKKIGINGNRIIFANCIPIEDHLNRLRFADLFLDTFPYGAHTTCSDALRMGLPVITMIGRSFASRVAASLLTTIGLPELITCNRQQYEEAAIRLASHTNELKEIKNRLIENKQTSPLFNSELYTRNLENLYKKMFELHHAGEPFTHLWVE